MPQDSIRHGFTPHLLLRLCGTESHASQRNGCQRVGLGALTCWLPSQRHLPPTPTILLCLPAQHAGSRSIQQPSGTTAACRTEEVRRPKWSATVRRFARRPLRRIRCHCYCRPRTSARDLQWSLGQCQYPSARRYLHSSPHILTRRHLGLSRPQPSPLPRHPQHILAAGRDHA